MEIFRNSVAINTGTMLAWLSAGCATSGEESEANAQAPSDPAGTGATPGEGGGVEDSGESGQGTEGVRDDGSDSAETGDTSTPVDDECVGVNSVANASVDIVFVIDNSGSMGDEIEKVRRNINESFLSIIGASNLSWNLIMVTARQGVPNLLGGYPLCVDSPPAGANCSDTPPRFHHVHCQVESTDSLTSLAFTFEGVFPSFHIGLSPVCGQILTIPMSYDNKAWKNYLRFSATKVFVEVTDDESDVQAAVFDNWLLNEAAPNPPPGMFGTADDRKYVFHSIVGMDRQNASAACSSAENSAEAPGTIYQELSALTGGLTASICDDEWSPIFNEIAEDIVNHLSCEYPVPDAPDGQALDPNQVNVLYTPGGGTQETIGRDKTTGCAEGADGWQWNAAGDAILLCGPACDRVKRDPTGKVEIKFGCATEDVIR